MKGNPKTIIFKLILAILILLGFNVIYKRFFLEEDLLKYSPDVLSVRNAINSEVVYIGESSNITYKAEDIDKRSISEFISDYYPNIKLSSIIKPASHAGIYYDLLNSIPPNSSVKTVIVTLNLRSFSAGWIYSNLESPLQKDVLLLKRHPPLFNRFLLSFKGYDVKTDEERLEQVKSEWKNQKLKFPFPFQFDNVNDWEGWVAVNGIKDGNGKVNPSLTELATHYIKAYAFQIDTLSNPRIEDFDKIVLLAKDRNWNLVFNLVAENTQRANEFLGYPLIYLINQNRALLKNRYTRKGVVFVDNLDAVANKDFIEQNWTSEHYSEFGRKSIAKKVAKSLMSFYPNNFTNLVDETPKKDSIFFNDFEVGQKWGQSGMITYEYKFSGLNSSKIKPYSITFSYPIEFICRSKTVNVSFHFYQKNDKSKSSLIFEFLDNEGKIITESVYVSNLNKIQKNKWNFLEHNFKLPIDFNLQKLIKVYVFNPDLNEEFIDDFKLVFKN